MAMRTNLSVVKDDTKLNIPDKSMKHYDGPIGTFDYDSTEWAIRTDCGPEYLAYKGNFSKEIILPQGLKSCKNMFAGRNIPEGFALSSNFDTSQIINMEGMFEECKLPNGFTLGDKFDTSNVRDMSFMFCASELPEGFTFGDKFNVRNVTNMECMFYKCKVPKNFFLDTKFLLNDYRDTKNLDMFKECVDSDNVLIYAKYMKSVHDKDYVVPDNFNLLYSPIIDRDIIFWLCSRNTNSYSDSIHCEYIKLANRIMELIKSPCYEPELSIAIQKEQRDFIFSIKDPHCLEIKEWYDNTDNCLNYILTNYGAGIASDITKIDNTKKALINKGFSELNIYKSIIYIIQQEIKERQEDIDKLNQLIAQNRTPGNNMNLF